MSEHIASRAPRRGVARRRAAQLRLRHLRRAGDGARLRRRRLGVAGGAQAGADGGPRRDVRRRGVDGARRVPRDARRARLVRARAAARGERGRRRFRTSRSEELRDIYRKKGLDGETLERVVDVFTANEQRWVDIMMSEELGLSAGRELAVVGRAHRRLLVHAWRRRCHFCPTCSSSACARCSASMALTAVALVRRRRGQGADHAAAGAARGDRDDDDGTGRHGDLLGHRAAVAHLGGWRCDGGCRVTGAAVKHALVTGASSGIGRGLALALGGGAARTWSSAARRRERLDELVARDRGRAAAAPRRSMLDVADGDATHAAVRAADARRPIDFIVANAGHRRHHAGQEARLGARQGDPRDQPRRRRGHDRRRRAGHGRARRRAHRRRRQRRRVSRAAALRRLLGVEGRAHHAVRELAHRSARHRRVGHDRVPGLRADRAADARQVAPVRRLRRRSGRRPSCAPPTRATRCAPSRRRSSPACAPRSSCRAPLYEFVATRAKKIRY